jgi:hypothetical protein
MSEGWDSHRNSRFCYDDQRSFRISESVGAGLGVTGWQHSSMKSHRECASTVLESMIVDGLEIRVPVS